MSKKPKYKVEYWTRTNGVDVHVICIRTDVELSERLDSNVT